MFKIKLSRSALEGYRSDRVAVSNYSKKRGKKEKEKKKPALFFFEISYVRQAKENMQVDICQLPYSLMLLKRMPPPLKQQQQ